MTHSSAYDAARGIVIIGGSAGAMTQVEKILAALPGRLLIPVVLVLHRGDDVSAGTGLTDRLSRIGSIRVEAVEDLEIYRLDVVHLAPPGYHTLIGREGPTLSSEPRQSFSIPSIDAAFESAADAFGANAVAVALSCANIDGLLGADRILNAGGRVLVVDPDLVDHPALARRVAERQGAEVASPDLIADRIRSMQQP